MGKVSTSQYILPFEDTEDLKQDLLFILDKAEGLMTPLVVGVFFAINQGHTPDIFSEVMYQFHQAQLDFRDMISQEESTEETYALIQSSDDYLDNQEAVSWAASAVFNHLKRLYGRIHIPETILDKVVDVILGDLSLYIVIAA